MGECANCGQPCDGDFCDHTCFSAWWDYQTDLALDDQNLHWTEVA